MKFDKLEQVAKPKPVSKGGIGGSRAYISHNTLGDSLIHGECGPVEVRPYRESPPEIWRKVI